MLARGLQEASIRAFKYPEATEIMIRSIVVRTILSLALSISEALSLFRTNHSVETSSFSRQYPCVCVYAMCTHIHIYIYM